jgi:tryptophanyl-tRNA synthetase
MFAQPLTRMLTGLQPSGELHLGNYFGSIKPLVDFMNAHTLGNLECYLMVADWHALTTLRDPETLRNNIRNLVKDYLALGIDPERVVLFQQSANPHHLELAWVFNCLVSVPFLKQAHAYKDKVARGIEPSGGLFTYPTLMAADIALYDTNIVPVGEDQRQHIEYTREAVQKFNSTYGELLTQPKEHILTDVGIIPGLDGHKMSKSYQNTIPLFSDTETIYKLTKKIVTDSDGAWPEHVFALHRLFSSDVSQLESFYRTHQRDYKTLKETLAADIEEFMQPLRAFRESLSDEYIDEVIQRGNEHAQKVAAEKMKTIRNAIGINGINP